VGAGRKKRVMNEDQNEAGGSHSKRTRYWPGKDVDVAKVPSTPSGTSPADVSMGVDEATKRALDSFRHTKNLGVCYFKLLYKTRKFQLHVSNSTRWYISNIFE
jgi:hypothetical protein